MIRDNKSFALRLKDDERRLYDTRRQIDADAELLDDHGHHDAAECLDEALSFIDSAQKSIEAAIKLLGGI